MQMGTAQVRLVNKVRDQELGHVLITELMILMSVVSSLGLGHHGRLVWVFVSLLR